MLSESYTVSQSDAYASAKAFYQHLSDTSCFHLLYFKEAKGWICLDFQLAPVVSHALYLLPPGHFALMSGEAYAGIQVEALDQQCISAGDWWHLAKAVFSKDKQVNVCLPDRSSVSGELPSGWMAYAVRNQVLSRWGQANLNAVNGRYGELAYSFRELAMDATIALEVSQVPDLAARLFHHERTVRRACLATFGLSPGAIIRYYQTVAAVKMLLVEGASIESVSDRLHFSDVSKFTRFLKKQMHMTPAVLRQHINQGSGPLGMGDA